MKMPSDLRRLRLHIVILATSMIALCAMSCLTMLAVPLIEADMTPRRQTLEALSNQPASTDQQMGDDGDDWSADSDVSAGVPAWCRVAVDDLGGVIAVERGGDWGPLRFDEADFSSLVALRSDAGSSSFSHGGRTWIGVWQPLGVQEGAMAISEGGASRVEGASAKSRLYTFLDVSSHDAFALSLIWRCCAAGAGITLVAGGVVALAATRALRPVAESRERERDFVLAASHELKTPLMGIMSACDVIDAEAALDQRSPESGASHWTALIRESADEMTAKITSMLGAMRF